MAVKYSGYAAKRGCNWILLGAISVCTQAKRIQFFFGCLIDETFT